MKSFEVPDGEYSQYFYLDRDPGTRHPIKTGPTDPVNWSQTDGVERENNPHGYALYRRGTRFSGYIEGGVKGLFENT